MKRDGFYYTLFMSQFKGKIPGGEKGTAALAASWIPIIESMPETSCR